MKSRIRSTENDKTRFTACSPSDADSSRQRFQMITWQLVWIVFLLLLSIGPGLGAATAQAPIRAYVTLSNSNSVSVIDTSSNTVIATIPVGGFPDAVAITSDGSRAYVANGLDNTVSVIDTPTNTVVATVSLLGTLDCAQTLCLSPFGIAITPDGTRAYVSNTTSSTLSVIDVPTNTVVTTIPSGASGLPDGVAVTPDGTRVYVTQTGSAAGDAVSVIETATNTVTTTISIGGVPVGEGVAITPDGTRAYVAILNSNTVLVIDTATNSVVGTIPVGVFPDGVAITPDGRRAYVTNSNSNTVSVIDTATNTVVGTIPVSAPFAIAITSDGSRAYVTDLSSGVSVIDLATNSVVATIPDLLVPFSIAITPTPQAPQSKDDCKHGGYLKFSPPAGPFKNQGQCVSYVEHHYGLGRSIVHRDRARFRIVDETRPFHSLTLIRLPKQVNRAGNCRDHTDYETEWNCTE